MIEMRIDELIKKMKTEVLPYGLDWEDSLYLRENYVESLPKLFEALFSLDILSLPSNEVVILFDETKGVISEITQEEKYSLPGPVSTLFSRYIDGYLEAGKTEGFSNLEEYGKIIHSILSVISRIPEHRHIEHLLKLMKPVGPRDLPERIIEQSLRALEKLTLRSSKFDGRKLEHSPEELSEEDIQHILNTMVNGHLKDTFNDVAIFCECGIEATTLDLSQNNESSDDDRLECSVCNYYINGEYYTCEGCKMLICHDVCVSPTLKGVPNREIALEIITNLNSIKVVPHVMPFLDSEFSYECTISLNFLEHFWSEEYLDKVFSIVQRSDASYSTIAAIRLTGEFGDGHHIDVLLNELERYSKLSGKGFKIARDAVENSLVKLREHCKEQLVFLAIDEHISTGYRNSVKRVIKMINEVENQRERVARDWRPDLYSWRSDKAHEENKDYSFQILTGDAILKIYNRQPLTYIDLMSIDGIGAYKVNRYGFEILTIVNNNQLERYKEEVPRAWKLSEDVEEHLLHSCMHQFNRDDVEKIPESDIAKFLRSRDCHTKGQLRRILHEQFINEEKEIINKLLEYVLIKITSSETDFTLLEGGVKRGKRFALITN